MYCPECSTELPDDSKFCIKCRYDFARITSPPSKKQGHDSLDGLGTSIEPELDIDSFAEGSLFANRYKILDEGKKGGMGAVYKCKDSMLNNKIKALKVIHPRLLSSRQARSRFRQEVAISQELQHENIVRVYDIEEWQGNEYFTMEWVEGVSLREIITKRKKENRPFSIEEAYQIVSQLSEALHHAHRYTIHRDIKPENILIAGAEQKVKLTDFGIAKMLSPSQFTSTSMQMGTPYYMAPEQKVDAGNVDKRADIYALGVVLYELLTLENTIGLEMPSEINKDLPSAIDAIIKKAVATKPNDRYADAKDLAEALKNVTDRFSEHAETSLKEVEEEKQIEADQKKIEEQERCEEKQRQQTVETERTTITGTSGQQESFSFTHKAIAVIAVLVIFIGIYVYKTGTEMSPQVETSATMLTEGEGKTTNLSPSNSSPDALPPFQVGDYFVYTESGYQNGKMTLSYTIEDKVVGTEKAGDNMVCDNCQDIVH